MFFVASRTASAQPLPEGNTGIAARHPNDANIGSDPQVVFRENFENVSGGSLNSSNCPFTDCYGANSITQVPSNVHSGIRAVEVTHASAPTGFGAIKYLGAGFDTLHLRYYIKYDAQFPGLHHTGGPIYAAAGSSYTPIGNFTGVRPNGTNHFFVLLDAIPPYFSWSPPGNDTPPGWHEAYTYSMDQADVWGDVLLPTGVIIPGISGVSHGGSFIPRPNVVSQRDRWISFELMVKVNTPGVANGRIAMWMDGRLVADFPALRFRSSENLRINHAGIESYSSEVHPHQTLWYDDVVVATSYIGPMVSSSSGSAPAPPTNVRIIR